MAVSSAATSIAEPGSAALAAAEPSAIIKTRIGIRFNRMTLLRE
jgi:hypothetical protein